MKFVADSFSISVLPNILKLLGIVIDSKQHWYTKLYLSYYFSVTYVPSLGAEFIVLFTFESFIYKFDAIVYITLTLLIPLELLDSNRRRPIFLEIHQIIKSNHDYMDDQFHKQCDQKLRKSFFTMAKLIFGVLTMVVLYPILLAIFTDAEYGSPPTLLYPCVFPWKINGITPYVFAFATQLAMSVIPISVMGAIPLYFQYARNVLESLSDVLQRKIRTMNALGREFVQLKEVAAGFGPAGSNGKVSEELYTRLERECDEKMLKELRGIFRYHQFQVKYDVNRTNQFQNFSLKLQNFEFLCSTPSSYRKNILFLK